MSLLGFLEAGGESVIRGILSTLTPTERREIADGSPTGIADVADRLHRKGYGRYNLTGRQIRDTVTLAAQSMEAADALNRGLPIGTNLTPIPAFPASELEGTFSYLVRAEIRHPDGTTSTIVTQVESSQPAGRALVRQLVSEVIEQNRQVDSDPGGRGVAGTTLVNMTVISVYGSRMILP